MHLSAMRASALFVAACAVLAQLFAYKCFWAHDDLGIWECNYNIWQLQNKTDATPEPVVH